MLKKRFSQSSSSSEAWRLCCNCSLQHSITQRSQPFIVQSLKTHFESLCEITRNSSTLLWSSAKWGGVQWVWWGSCLKFINLFTWTPTHTPNFVVFDARGAMDMFLVVCWLWMPLVKKETMHWCKILGKNIWLQLDPIYEWHLEYYHMYAYNGWAFSLKVHRCKDLSKKIGSNLTQCTGDI